MSQLFEINPVDTEYYNSRIKDFLPQKIIDIHTHVYLQKFRVKDRNKKLVTWPARVARENPIEDLIESYKLMFPDKQVIPLMFSSLTGRNDDFEGGNQYVSECSREHDFPALIFARPEWSSQEFENNIRSGGFIGAKVYLSLAQENISKNEIKIFDFLPHNHLEVLDQHGWIVMLHIPRDLRLRDPENIKQMIEIDKKYPNLKCIIAHVGRAYCKTDVGDAFERLADSPNLLYDISANTNAWVFEQLIKAVGPKRILFGSDLPILRMRMRRIEKEGRYVNLVPKGLYGDVSADKNMGGVQGEEAEKLSFFMYEEINAFRQAAEATGLSTDDIEDVFHNNGHRIITETRGIK
jgi:predicted TIM-barrel fold metal-dependent hydrolase